MSLSASFFLAAAATSGPGHDAQATRGTELAEVRVTARILPVAVVRQSSGPEPPGDRGPRHQLTQRGKTILVEFE
jgi:hypothetical protein